MIRLMARCALPLALLLAACDLGPDYLRPQVEMPVQFRATEATETAAWPAEDWWHGFDLLLTPAAAEPGPRRTSTSSPPSPGSARRMPRCTHRRRRHAAERDRHRRQSWEQVGATRALPASRAAAARVRRSTSTTTASARRTVAYEVDFWGKNRAARQSAASLAMFSRFDQQVVALTVVTNVANALVHRAGPCRPPGGGAAKPGRRPTDAGGDPRPAGRGDSQRTGCSPNRSHWSPENARSFRISATSSNRN